MTADEFSFLRNSSILLILDYCQVSVVIPHKKDLCGNLVDSIQDDSDYYKVEGLPAHQIVDKEFIEAFVKRGKKLLSFTIQFYMIYRFRVKDLMIMPAVIIHNRDNRFKYFTTLPYLIFCSQVI